MPYFCRSLQCSRKLAKSMKSFYIIADLSPKLLVAVMTTFYIFFIHVLIFLGGDDVAGTVVRVWYSVCISEQDFAFLTSALRDLVTATELRTLTGGLMEVSADQLSQLKSVWTTWIRLSPRKGPWVEELRHKNSSFDSDWEDSISHYIHAIPKEHRMSTRHFFDTGIFHSSTNDTELTRQNFTLTGQGFLRFKVSCDYDCSIPADEHPFTGWDYKAIKKTGCYAASLPKIYTIYLAQILQKCFEKFSSDQVKFHFILCDVLNIKASLPIDLRYDRITTSNLWDYCPLTILLTKFKGFLNESNPYAVMLTETICWSQNYMPEVIHVLSYFTGVDDLYNRALKDTRNHELTHLSGLRAVLEYLDFTDPFNMFLRASLLVSCTEKELASFRKKKRILSVKSLVSSLGLHLRDFIRNENTVFPFRWALNCRRVVMLHGHERALEWKLVRADSAKEEAASE